MKEKFNLSKKRIAPKDENNLINVVVLYLEEDVKEAIRLIKLNPNKIDEIVGEKLI